MGQRFYFVLATFGLIACVSSLRAEPNELNGGYYLLNDLGKDESSIPMLFIIKDAPEQVSDFAKQIGKVADDTTTALDHMADTYPSVHLDQQPLPQIELDVRASIREDKKHQLVFGTSGTEFIRAFLVSQIQASTYGQNLSKVLAEKETNPRRAKVFLDLSVEWQKVRDDAYRILRDY